MHRKIECIIFKWVYFAYLQPFRNSWCNILILARDGRAQTSGLTATVYAAIIAQCSKSAPLNQW